MATEAREKGRRAKGTGSLYQRPGSPMWYIRIQVGDRIIDRSLKEKNKAKAEVKAAGVIALAETADRDELAAAVAAAKGMGPLQGVALAESLRAFRVSPNRPDSGERTLRDYEFAWKRFLKWAATAHPEVVYVTQITREVAQEYASVLGARRLAPASFNGYVNQLGMVTRVLFGAVSAHLVNPWDSIAHRSIARDRQMKKVFSEDGARMLMATIAATPPAGNPKGSLYLTHREEWRVVFLLGMFAGLRLVDALTLEWADVRIEAGTISLVPVKTRRTGKRVEIPIHPDLAAALAAARGNQAGVDGAVSPGLAAWYRRNPAGPQKAAVRIIRASGFVTSVPRVGRARQANQYGFHSLRHTFVSWCAMQGVPISTVQALVGHGSPAMTFYYTHMDMGSASAAIGSLPGLALASPAALERRRLERAAACLAAGPEGSAAERGIYAAVQARLAELATAE